MSRPHITEKLRSIFAYGCTAGLAAVLFVGCGVSDDSPEPTVNHEESGQDFIRVNDIYMIGSTDSESATSGAAEVIGTATVLEVFDENRESLTEYRLRVPIVDDSGAAIQHLDGATAYAIDMEVRPGVLGSPTAYIPFEFSVAVAAERITD